MMTIFVASIRSSRVRRLRRCVLPTRYEDRSSTPWLKAHEMNPKRRETLLGLEGIHYSLQDVDKSEEYRHKYEALDEGGVPEAPRQNSPQLDARTDEACLMASSDDWKGLGLSSEQLERVRDIQERFRKGGPGDLGARIEELRTVLTPEQSTRWQAWCVGKRTKDK